MCPALEGMIVTLCSPSTVKCYAMLPPAWRKTGPGGELRFLAYMAEPPSSCNSSPTVSDNPLPTQEPVQEVQSRRPGSPTPPPCSPPPLSSPSSSLAWHQHMSWKTLFWRSTMKPQIQGCSFQTSPQVCLRVKCLSKHQFSPPRPGCNQHNSVDLRGIDCAGRGSDCLAHVPPCQLRGQP